MPSNFLDDLNDRERVDELSVIQLHRTNFLEVFFKKAETAKLLKFNRRVVFRANFVLE